MKKVTYIASTLLAALAVGVQAQSIISFNYDAYGTIPTTATDFAGVVNAAYWNDSWTIDNNAGGGSSTYANLLDNSGATTTLSLATATANGIYQIQNTDPGANNARLLNGYINGGGANSTTFTLTGIPYLQYDIYVYFGSDTAGRTGTVSDGTTTYDFSAMGSAALASGGTFVQTTDTGGSNPSADYAVFSSLSGSSKTITATIPAFGGLAGIQIVAVPEPATLTLVGLGGLAMLVLVRRKSKSTSR